MKALFYTATAIFIGLAGMIAFFALQTPATVGGARIVLDIDASAMPVVETDSSSSSFPEPYANEVDDKPAEAAQDSSASGASPDAGAQYASTAAPEEGGRPSTESPQEQTSAPVQDTVPGSLASNGQLLRAPETSPQADSAASPGSLAPVSPADPTADPTVSSHVVPGTNVELFNSTASESGSVRGDASASRDQAEPTTAVSIPADVAALGPKEAAQPPVPVAVLPPVPVRRPNNIPASEERLASAEGNWAGTQFATTEVSTPKPARIAILVRGIGRNDPESVDAIAKLPSAVSLGFLPYANESRRLAVRAREMGHEVIVQLPLEPADYPANDPGPETLLTSLPPEQNASRLQALLNRFEGHSGVTNFMGGKMLQSKASLKPVLEDLKSRGLIYVAESSTGNNTVRQLARQINLRYGAAHVLIDAQTAPDAIDKALSRLVAIARERGSAIGMGSANAATIRQLQAWSETLAAQGITLVPVGALAQAPGAS